MALVNIVIGSVSNKSSTGVTMPIMDTEFEDQEAMTSSGVASISTISIENDVKTKPRFWSITSKGDIWVCFGTDPDISVDKKELILANTTRYFYAKNRFEKVSIIDAV